MQLIDQHGVVLSRSWTSISGENLAQVRDDVKQMLANPKIQSTISAGHFDLSFKAMVPLYDNQAQFIGFLEVITHFNSIAEKLQQLGYESVVLVDKSYFDQLTRPFSKKFIQQYYVANLNAPEALLDRLKTANLEQILRVQNNYQLSEDQSYLIMHTPIFEDHEKLADFLVFKKVQQIDLNLIQILTTNIQLIMGVLILILGMFFYFIGFQDAKLRTIENRAPMPIFGLLFVIFTTLLALITYQAYQQERSIHLEIHNDKFAKNYQIIKQKYQTLAETTLKLLIIKPEIISLLELAYSPEPLKSEARQKLYELLEVDYQILRFNHLRQLHFHLKDNESFLRFHRPQRFGDDLSLVRPTVAYVNQYFKPINGFEEGRIFNGYRHIFPIQQVKPLNSIEHLGSVELSFSPYAIAKDFAQLYKLNSEFMIKTEVVDAKVLDTEKANYTLCDFPNYYYDAEFQNAMNRQLGCANIKNKFNDLEILQSRIDRGDLFSIESKDSSELFTFIPLKNPVSGLVVATYIFEQKNDALNAIKTQYITWFLLSLLVIILVMAFLHKEIKNVKRFRQLSEKTQQILDAQKTMIVVNDGKTLINANQSFLDFFGYATLEEFSQQHQCICDFFEPNDRFFHLGKVPENSYWIDHARHLENAQQTVEMKNAHGERGIFAFNISAFAENRQILTFTNITDTMSEHFELENRAARDHLTGAYNRSYLQEFFPVFQQTAKKAHKHVGFILFDIDHFKAINDTYGHNLGDEVLIALVKLIVATIRADDLLIRWGGEEFLVLVKINKIEDAQQIAENLRLKIAAHPFAQNLQVTCSFGVTIDTIQSQIERTIELADQALYQSKETGRNKVTVQKIPAGETLTHDG